MISFLFAFVLLSLSILGLALGVIFGRAPIRGSCGGLACHKGLGCAGCPARDAHETGKDAP